MIIKYDPKTVKNTAKFLNDSLESYKNEKYIMFIFNDIYDDIIDINQFYYKYVNLLKRFNLPFAFYPYYIHFNKVLWRSLSFGAPKMKISINKDRACDVINQAAYGMLIIDTEKLKSINFKFDESFKLCFYIQDLAEECFKNKLTLSASSFLDVDDSFSMLKSPLKEGHFIDAKLFAEEKTKFYAKNTPQKEDVNEFIKALKDKCQKIKENELNSVQLIYQDDEITTINYEGDKE